MNTVIRFENVDLEYKRRRKMSLKKILVFSKSKQTSIINKYKALNDVSFSIEKGKILGVIGNNGAGKSTLLRTISGNMKVDAGKATINCEKVSLLALGVGFNKDLTGIENIYLNGMLLGFKKKQIDKNIEKIIAFSELGNFIYQPIKTYSSGMVSRLGFAIAINLKPDVLLIDETLSVGDIKFREKSFRALKKVIQDTDTTVILVSHNLEQIRSLCDEVMWLDKGYVAKIGPTEEVLEAYINKTKEERINNGSIVKIDDMRIGIDLSDYEFTIAGETKRNDGQVIDVIAELSYKNSVIKVTKRALDNGDFFIYFEVFNPQTLNIQIDLDKIEDIMNFNKLYKKPKEDSKYGDNIVTGPMAYFDLKKGSAMLSKVYYYDEVAHRYEKDHFARAYDLFREDDGIMINENSVDIPILEEASIASFFILVSKTKLFRQETNIKGYFKSYFENVYNNNFWNSYFILPHGTMSKLPKDIEPKVNRGYGLNLYHSVRTELVPFLDKLDSRYFYDIILNSVLQMTLYQSNDAGFYLSSYTQGWLKEESNLTTPYLDIRANDNFKTFLQIISPFYKYQLFSDDIQVQNDAILRLIDDKNFVYKSGKGIFLPDYMDLKGKNKAYASIVNNASIANNLYAIYSADGNSMSLQGLKKIVAFLDDTKDLFVRSNGDLYPFIKEVDQKLIGSGEDKGFMTLVSLLKLQMLLMQTEHVINPSVDYLISTKINYLIKSKVIKLDDKKGMVFPQDQVSTIYQKYLKLKRDTKLV